MPSDLSGWRSTAGYDYVERLGASDLAWEWLRRNNADFAKELEDNLFKEGPISGHHG